MRSMVEGLPSQTAVTPPPLHQRLRRRSPSPSKLGEDFAS